MENTDNVWEKQKLTNEYALSVKYLNLINTTIKVTTGGNMTSHTCKSTKNTNNPKILNSFAYLNAT